MSVGSFITGGVGPDTTLGLFITEGFYPGEAAPPPPIDVVVGGIVKRRVKRYEITIAGTKFVAGTLRELEEIVSRYRKIRPDTDSAPVEIQRPKPVLVPERPAARAESTPAPVIPKAVPLRLVLPTIFPGTATALNRLRFEEMDRKAAYLAAETTLKAVLAELHAQEDEDMDVINWILQNVA